MKEENNGMKDRIKVSWDINRYAALQEEETIGTIDTELIVKDYKRSIMHKGEHALEEKSNNSAENTHLKSESDFIEETTMIRY